MNKSIFLPSNVGVQYFFNTVGTHFPFFPDAHYYYSPPCSFPSLIVPLSGFKPCAFGLIPSYSRYLQVYYLLRLGTAIYKTIDGNTYYIGTL